MKIGRLTQQPQSNFTDLSVLLNVEQSTQ